MPSTTNRFGARMLPDGGVGFRLWAPAARTVELVLPGSSGAAFLPMPETENGWYALDVHAAGPGTRYLFRVDGGLQVPDPASRFQPDDVHGPSEVIDPEAYLWEDAEWRGRPWHEAVFYELHVGTFTQAGTFQAVIPRLDDLAALGVTAIELMPVADFPGARNWGYDGVLPFAPDSRYGRPEDLKDLVQAAHRRGLMIFLDVVYNHFGPEGNYLHAYAPNFFTERHHTPWGAAINFDGPDSRPVRDFFIQNALYWLEEYRFDGLRLDAVHAIVDDSTPDILTELAEAVRAGPGQRRTVHLVLENDDNCSRYLARDAQEGPRWYDAQWNDDIHHAFHVLLTGESGGYYRDYADAPARHLGRCLTEGFAYQGEPSPYRDGAHRGETSRDLPATSFVAFLQNHDQIGNRAFGERISSLAPSDAVRAATEILLLAPSPPLLFMGQEWGSRCPFPFFCDFGPDLAALVTEGRRREFARFPAFSDPAVRARIPDPNAPGTRDSAVLDWHAREQPDHSAWLALHRELLWLREREIVPRLWNLKAGEARFRLMDASAILAEWRLGDGCLLHLLANLSDAPLHPVAPPPGKRLYATPGAGEALDTGQIPPWSTVWILASERR